MHCKLDWKEIDTVVFDFDGVFTDNTVTVDQNGIESVICSRADGLGFDLLKKFAKLKSWNFDMFILSKETNPVVLTRAQKLGVKCIQSQSNKYKYMLDYFSLKGIPIREGFSRMLFVGNDLNDYELMKNSSYSCAPIDSHPLILEVAKFKYPRKGGDGLLRLVIEDLLCISEMDSHFLCDLLNA